MIVMVTTDVMAFGFHTVQANSMYFSRINRFQSANK